LADVRSAQQVAEDRRILIAQGRDASDVPITQTLEPNNIGRLQSLDRRGRAAMLPEAKRTSTMKAEIASHILACAAKGERNPTTLKIAALSAVVECTHYSHDISPERRAV
jgi:hypothetical protein